MNYHAKRRVNHYIEVDGIEVEIDYEPYDSDHVLVERIGSKLVVAYLVQDCDGFNPIENGDCNGELITLGSRWGRNNLSTDDHNRVYGELGLNWDDETPDLDREFKLEGKSVTLRELAADQFYATFQGDEDLKQKWLEYQGVELVEDETYEIDLVEVRRDMEDVNGCFSEEVMVAADDLYSKHWRAIVGPFVVPMSYCDHYCDTTISLDNWDGDYTSPPDAIWVADKGAIENIGDGMAKDCTVGQIKGADGRYTSEYELLCKGERVAQGTLGACLEFMRATYPMGEQNIIEAAEKYAEAICTEYAEWASGNVFGCVVHTYTFEPSNTPCDNIEDAIDECEGEWEMDTDEIGDQVWGFIGYDYAKVALQQEFFEAAITRIKKKDPAQINLELTTK